ncbi:MAG: hypothetical protein GF390_01790, partial [Candidatus Pacebacteria bacterium]|nr:hypothetical protein [Candidatus Paceibacterota bacterium]
MTKSPEREKTNPIPEEKDLVELFKQAMRILEQRAGQPYPWSLSPEFTIGSLIRARRALVQQGEQGLNKALVQLLDRVLIY